MLQSRQTLSKSKYFYRFYLRENPGAYNYINQEIIGLRYLFSMGKDITFYSDTTSSFYGGAFLSEEAYFFNQGWSGREGRASSAMCGAAGTCRCGGTPAAAGLFYPPL